MRGFQIDAGLRIQGGASRQPRNSLKHSLRLLFKRDYGPGDLEFPLFPDAPARSFNTVILRAEYNNSWIHWDTQQRLRGSYVRDQVGEIQPGQWMFPPGSSIEAHGYELVSVNRLVEQIHPNPDPSSIRYFRLRTFRTQP